MLVEPALIRGLDGWLKAGACPAARTQGPIRQAEWVVGRNAVKDGADRGFLVPRGMGAAQGKKLWAAPLQQGARGAAVPCQPKPLTRPWVSAVLAVTPKDMWQAWVGAFNVRLAHSSCETDSLDLLGTVTAFCQRQRN
jgi:hypothetical protein